MGNTLEGAKRAFFFGSGVLILFLAVYRAKQSLDIVEIHIKRFRIWFSYLLATAIDVY